MFLLHHVALSVSNLDRSMEFYRLFDFTPVHHWTSPDGDLDIVHLRLDNTILELFCYRNHSPAPIHTTALATDLPVVGIKHFGLRVTSLSEARERLEAAGLTCTATKHGRTEIDYFFVQDPDGNWVEIVQDDRVLD